MRAKRDEPFISMPLTWREISRAQSSKDRDALYFTPAEALRRLRKSGDLFAPVLTLSQQLPEAFARLAANGVEETTAASPRRKAAASLRRYAEKRDFTQTAEPAGNASSRRAPPAGASRFV